MIPSSDERRLGRLLARASLIAALGGPAVSMGLQLTARDPWWGVGFVLFLVGPILAFFLAVLSLNAAPRRMGLPAASLVVAIVAVTITVSVFLRSGFGR